MHALLQFFVPWEPSPLAWLLAIAAIVLYWRGQRLRPVSRWRRAAWWIGLALCYVAMQSRWDYFSEHAFFLQRLQHLVLHHLGPFLLVLAYPGPQLRAALPLRWRVRGARVLRHMAPLRWALNVLLNPWVAASLFVGVIALWLYPPVQFVAMLDDRIYRLMNWSMLLDGFLFWWLVLDPRAKPPARLSPGMRVVLPLLGALPQIMMGAFITFTGEDLYPAFEVCGRAFPWLTFRTDQYLGGLIIWIPAAMMSVIAALLAMRRWTLLDARRHVNARRRASP
ncbi:MAG: cytochrome c oxidase assembly protein [Metallibacterium scheffleri]|jgi:putative membrane protein|uniref:cytochrome c oxidase assembly protein n=1 Tax=Metallibacterium scheffleri TaxID=993689 RepID=UPI0026E9D0A9|nr:cytochrome c oxidase assembly protein [Metallibacterium scheffleri]MCK9366045.1 cytochrome c oxidase assembly protein [Metallibacterium scheffleri]